MRDELSRRDFVKAAVAVGGSAGLSACLELQGSPDVPSGTSNPSSLPERQHAWNDHLDTDAHGKVVDPRHRVLLLLDYAGDNIENDRETFESALTKLERAYNRGNDGLLFTVSYSPAYFESRGVNVEPEADLQKPEPLAPFENPDFDENDAVLHLASDYPHVVIEVEEALFGDVNELNGVKVEESLSGIFDKYDRRTGFVGKGLPAENQDVDGIPDSKPVPDDSPLYMGFKSGFEKNQASE
ncbi:MAG: twin-arginine translocation signal domain-containing protein, partial [Halobacteria archaeon]|nr:twin-arginine translocation signal domain-containing protein [Halobacteria archaeon]